MKITPSLGATDNQEGREAIASVYRGNSDQFQQFLSVARLASSQLHNPKERSFADVTLHNLQGDCPNVKAVGVREALFKFYPSLFVNEDQVRTAKGLALATAKTLNFEVALEVNSQGLLTLELTGRDSDGKKTGTWRSTSFFAPPDATSRDGSVALKVQELLTQMLLEPHADELNRLKAERQRECEKVIENQQDKQEKDLLKTLVDFK